MPAPADSVYMRKECLAVGMQIVEMHKRDENQTFDNEPRKEPTSSTVANRGGGEGCIRHSEVSDLERALELHGVNVAAFLVEPIQDEPGYITGDSPILGTNVLIKLCKKHNVLLINDKIQTVR